MTIKPSALYTVDYDYTSKTGIGNVTWINSTHGLLMQGNSSDSKRYYIS